MRSAESNLDSSTPDEIFGVTDGSVSTEGPRGAEEPSTLEEAKSDLKWRKAMEEERILDEIKENSKVETEVFHKELVQVRFELEPWEKELIEHKGKLDVACMESKLLSEKHEAGWAAFGGAQEQIKDLKRRIEAKTSSLSKIQSDVEKKKIEASEAREVEQRCIEEQERLIPLEQAEVIGGKPRGGKMGTSIRTTSVPAEVIGEAEIELSRLVESLNDLRRKAADAGKQYLAVEKSIPNLEMDLAKSQKEIDSLKSQHSDLEKQLYSLKMASEPKKDEVDKLQEPKEIIAVEEKEIERLTNGSKKLKEKALELQTKIENAGSERLRIQKAKFNKIQSDIDKSSTEVNRRKVQVETGMIDIQHVCTEDQRADILTKALARLKFLDMREKTGVRFISGEQQD